MLFLCLAVVLAVRYAGPVPDGDLFFHLAYAEQIRHTGSLVPDPTIYSWTPTASAMATATAIYCAWASELALDAVWRAAGLPGLFALRYAAVAGTLLLLALYARRRGLLAAASLPLTVLILIVVAVGEVGGSVLKPELFSLVLLHLVLFAYFHVKSEPARSAWLWLVPAVVAVWANSHGGFILLAPLLVLSAAGELANRRFSPGCALPWPALRRLLAAWALCGAAVLATPYGVRYLAQLAGEYLLQRTPRPDVAWNAAYQPLLRSPAIAAELLPAALIMMVMLVALFAMQGGLGARGTRLDWAVVLINAAYVPLFFRYVRSSHWWVVIFGWSAVYSLGRLRAGGLPALLPPRFAARAGALIAGVAVLAGAWLSAITVRDAWLQPWPESWLGFGIGYVNPVPEAEFLARRATAEAGEAGEPGAPGAAPRRLYNLFESGSYLLWRLHPRYLVMTDSRSFPYLSWFQDQYRFTYGGIFADFQARYPARLAIIDHRHAACERNFLASPDWRPIFYGPTAGVFVRRGDERPGETAEPPPHGGLERLRNGATALRAFDFATATGDLAAAWSVLKQIEGPLRRQLASPTAPTAPDIAIRQEYREAWAALARRETGRGAVLLRQSLAGRTASARDRQAQALLASYAVAAGAGPGRQAEAARLASELAALAAR